MQRRQLHRDPRPRDDPAPGRGTADRMDGLLVIAIVARRVIGGRRRLAQHIVRVAEAPRLHLAAVGQRLRDGLTRNELLAHHPHRHIDATADQRLPAARDQPRQRGRQPGLAAGGDQPAGHHQPPGRGINEQRRRLAQMRVPVAGADLVADQRVARRHVGDAQQRLRQAHQRHTFLAGQRVFADQPLDRAARALRPQRLHQPAGERLGLSDGRVRQRRRRQQVAHAVRLGPAIGGGDGGAQGRLRPHIVGEGGERRRQ